MKAPLLSLICAFALLFSACSKEEAPAPKEEARYSVTFNVNSLSHDMVPMQSIKPTGAKTGAGASGGKLSDAVNYLFYYAFNERGNKVKEMMQLATQSDFGQFVDLFGKGKYTVLVVGRTQLTYDWFPDYNDHNAFYSHGLIDEVFYKKIDLVVADSEVEQDVTLQRKGGMIEIDILGNIPVDISEIRYSITGVSEHFVAKTNRGNNNQTFTRSTHFEPDGTQYHWDGGEPYKFYFFLDNDKATTATVRLTAFDRSQKLVAAKVIKDIPVAVNKRTKLRGHLFENTGNISAQSFSVSF